MDHKLVLLIEDNFEDATFVLRAFKEQNVPHQVVLVNDGVDGLNFLHGTGPFKDRDVTAMPSLIITDLSLPKLDGFEFLATVRADERTKHIPIVVLTASDEPRKIAKAYKLGANSYLHKAIGFQRFCELIELLSRYWLDFNMLPTNQ